MSSPDACFGSDQMLSAEQARAQLLQAATTLSQIESVPLREALGRVLAQDVVSPLDVPGYDNSAMDGYAVRAADIRVDGVVLPVSQRIAAGHLGQPLAPGSAARIFTGAALPEGADAVVIQEECEVQGESVRISRPVEVAANVRPRGNDIAAGDRVLSQGLLLTPAAVGLLASLGLAQVSVTRRPRVALLNTGDEIVEPGQPLGPGQIYNSNRYSLLALLQQAGCEVVDLGRIKDTLEATQAALRAAAQQADLILSSGGVSVGEEDHVKEAVNRLGRLDLWRVRMKPGKPLAFGQVGEVPFIGLPGNPVSALVTFCLFAMPFIRRMQGRAEVFPEPVKVRSGKAFPRPLRRREFQRVRIEQDAQGIAQAVFFPRQGSDVLSSVVWAEGLLEVPEDQSVDSRSLLNYWSFASLTT